jgi:hypothetical protein
LCRRTCGRRRSRAGCLGELTHERAHLVDELLCIERLVDEVVGADRCAARSIVRGLFARKDDHADARRFAFYLLAEVIAGAAAQAMID